jgi:hypothetical protein
MTVDAGTAPSVLATVRRNTPIELRFLWQAYEGSRQHPRPKSLPEITDVATDQENEVTAINEATARNVVTRDRAGRQAS